MDLVLIPTKPITVNKAWEYSVSRGAIPRVIKRKSEEYKIFEDAIKAHLTGVEFFVADEGPLSFRSVYSTTRIDLDNCMKAFIDVLEVVYGFNDNRIEEIHSRKIKVKKGLECIKFIITPYKCYEPELFYPPVSEDYNTLIFNVYRAARFYGDFDIFTIQDVFEWLEKESISLPYGIPDFLNASNVKLVISDLCSKDMITELQNGYYTIG